MIVRRVLAATPLVAAALLIAPGAQAQELPADCAVPPFIDLSQYNVIVGTDASEVLRGTEGRDFICGLLGNDVIHGLGGADLILADTTTFFGNVGAAGGNDIVFAGAGDDEILPGPGNDVVHGQDGDDFLALAVGDDIGNGGAGNDFINGGFGRDIANGGAGDDSVAGGFHNDVVNGGPGDDFVVGEIPADSPPPPPGVEVPAPATHDVCVGAAGTDTAYDCDVTAAVEG